ncbi:MULTISPECIES: DinB family protein [Fictibacillus]|uniref:DinB family protein n=1 Tax=Fictibacillus terranigra TaxID=3058424 RepID=A0ABT8EAZ9_9BACL|nr:DinB family protein [Fictibacillus sp. CENA-BCM004]MDN4075107.1 DinB family protein [Fictibacillus sp. CENA-BCM004]
MIEEYYNNWLKHRTVLHELLDQVGPEHVFFKPWSEGFSLGELAVHIVSSTDMFLATVKNGQFASPGTPRDFQTMDEVREIVQEFTHKSKRDFSVLKEADLNNEIDIFGYMAPGKYWIESLIDHEIHHKGQLFVYARMTGAEKVPFFKQLPSRAVNDAAAD